MDSITSDDYFEVLGIKRESTAQEISKAYKKVRRLPLTCSLYARQLSLTKRLFAFHHSSP